MIHRSLRLSAQFTRLHDVQRSQPMGSPTRHTYEGVDCIGVALRVSPLRSVYRNADGKELPQRRVTIVDESSTMGSEARGSWTHVSAWASRIQCLTAGWGQRTKAIPRTPLFQAVGRMIILR